MTKKKRSTWRMPVVLGVLTAIGLVGALFEDGAWDLLFGAALAAPVLAGCWYWLRPVRRT